MGGLERNLYQLLLNSYFIKLALELLSQIKIISNLSVLLIYLIQNKLRKTRNLILPYFWICCIDLLPRVDGLPNSSSWKFEFSTRNGLYREEMIVFRCRIEIRNLDPKFFKTKWLKLISFRNWPSLDRIQGSEESHLGEFFYLILVVVKSLDSRMVVN